MWRPTNHKPESIERSALGVEAGIRTSSVMRSIWSISRRQSSLRSRKLHSGRPSTSLARSTRTLSYTSARTWAPASTPACSGPSLRSSVRSSAPRKARPSSGELGGRRRNHRSLRGRASDDLRAGWPAPAPRHLPRQLPSMGVGCRRHGSRDRERAPRRGRSEHRQRPAPGPSRERR